VDANVDRIQLELPSDTRYLRLARLLASGVATSCGLPLEEVEDFRIAVDELCATLIEVGTGDPVTVVFEVAPDQLVVHGRTRARVSDDLDDERLRLSVQILDVVADGHDMTQVDGHFEFRARKHVRGGGVG
jgi:anti-sigma regulatory factor (Ser/Thr protein kinase)